MWMAQCQPGFLDELWASEVTKQNKKVDRVRETASLSSGVHICVRMRTQICPESGGQENVLTTSHSERCCGK